MFNLSFILNVCSFDMLDLYRLSISDFGKFFQKFFHNSSCSRFNFEGLHFCHWISSILSLNDFFDILQELLLNIINLQLSFLIKRLVSFHSIFLSILFLRHYIERHRINNVTLTFCPSKLAEGFHRLLCFVRTFSSTATRRVNPWTFLRSLVTIKAFKYFFIAAIHR